MAPAETTTPLLLNVMAPAETTTPLLLNHAQEKDEEILCRLFGDTPQAGFCREEHRSELEKCQRRQDILQAQVAAEAVRCHSQQLPTYQRAYQQKTAAKADSTFRKFTGLDPEALKPTASQVHCLQLSTARLLCSWCVKVVILICLTQCVFLAGPLSRPFWIPISVSKACQKNNDPIPCDPYANQLNMAGLRACEDACEASQRCQAIDWFNKTGWCNFYEQPCTVPTGDWDEASSFQIATGCGLQNGSQGILIGGHCRIGIIVPSKWSVIQEEVPKLLVSPWSWGLSFAVTLIYAYLMSQWFRKFVKPGVDFAGVMCTPLSAVYRCTCSWIWAGGCWRRAVAFTILMFFWCALTVYHFGPPPNNSDKLKELSTGEYVWLGCSLLALVLLLCKGCRTVVLSLIISIGSLLMNAFMSLAACAMSACFDTAGMGIAGIAGAAGVGGAGVAEAAVGAGAAGAVGVSALGDTAVAADAALLADGATSAEAAAGAQVAVDAAVAGEAAAEATVAAEGAAAATVAAESVAAAEGTAGVLGALALCSVQ